MISKVENIDCMQGMKQYPDKFFELAIVDPPYGIERFNRAKASLRFDKLIEHRNGIKWNIKPNTEYFKELFRVSRFSIIWGGNNFSLPETEYFLIWNKLQSVDNFATCEYAWTNCRKPARMYNYSIHKHNQIDKIHPTQKPVQLYRWLLKNYAQPNDKILDTHLGSQSSRIAAWDMGFDFYGFEIDEEYFEAGCKRFNDFKMQLTIF